MKEDRTKVIENGDSIIKMRHRNIKEMQPYLVGYGFTISLFSPTGSLYQLRRLNPSVKMGNFEMVKMAYRILPHQTLLKSIQMNISTPVKEYVNPWAAFAIVGMLQGGVYGQANIFFSRELKLGYKASYTGLFRGALFAGTRDFTSQGIPFMLSQSARQMILDPIWPTPENDPDCLQAKVKHWTALGFLSITGTFLSQALHNLQILMQSNQSYTYANIIPKAWTHYGPSLIYRGFEARVGVLMITNIANELLLKPAWSDLVPDE